MALSDLIKKIEDSPRSTKVAVCSVAFGVAAGAFALYTIVNQPERSPEPASAPKLAAETSSNAQPVPAPAAPQPTLPPVPTKTASPVPTSTPVPSPTSKPSETAVERPTPNPTATRAPVATPTPKVNDYYVVLYDRGKKGDGIGRISFYAEYPDGKYDGSSLTLKKDASFLSYLVQQNVIDSEQKNAYLEGEEIIIPLKDIANAVKKLRNEGLHSVRRHISELTERRLTYHADPVLPDSNENTSDNKRFSEDADRGYVAIKDGKISVSGTDDQGNTTTISVEGESAQTLIERWLKSNKITVAQRDEYGRTGHLEFSLEDGVDLFDLEYSASGGLYIGIDEEDQSKIKNILELFSSE